MSKLYCPMCRRPLNVVTANVETVTCKRPQSAKRWTETRVRCGYCNTLSVLNDAGDQCIEVYVCEANAPEATTLGEACKS